MGMGDNKNSTFSHFPPAGIADRQTLLISSCWFHSECLDILLALTLHVYYLKFWLIFSRYNCTVPRIVEFTGHLLSDEILLAVREWEREGMGIADGNGKRIGIKLG